MPDFSKLGGGFGVGSHASHAKVYIAVIEEYETGDVSVYLPSTLFLMSQFRPALSGIQNEFGDE